MLVISIRFIILASLDVTGYIDGYHLRFAAGGPMNEYIIYRPDSLPGGLSGRRTPQFPEAS
ncbi:hypothetical protein BJB45_13205 [Halomonas huangheensis]|uniref:Uncharacterized protein n=1 Tax=Halomonas huangheensis TaxID=1178482 RepID=W1N7U9_9GAMM|nr:hypothetical protein AR456_13940 [Halomonas huangheensis]ERL51608.1 hypothetical protein BJB45_13205 [Halomonas huangheensis]